MFRGQTTSQLPNACILIDDDGWGDLFLGVVIDALKLPARRYMERRIPVSSFQPPNFENKQCLDDAVRIAEEIVEVTQLTGSPVSRSVQDTLYPAYVDTCETGDSTWKK